MSNVHRLLALLIMTASLTILNQATLRAEPCSTSEYQAECNEAISAAEAACETSCWNQFHEHMEIYTGAECHWKGEDDPGNCIEDYGDECSCFRNISGGQCYCQGL